MTWQHILRTHPLAARADDALFWDEFLASNPDVLNRLLADIYRATYGTEKPPTLEALWALLETPEFTGQPLGPAVKELLARRKQSERWLAQNSGISRGVLRYYLDGTRSIVSVHDAPGSMRRIEAIAKPLRVHPSYFSEWRRLWLMTLLDSAFTAHPDLSSEAFKRFSGLARNAKKAAS